MCHPTGAGVIMTLGMADLSARFVDADRRRFELLWTFGQGGNVREFTDTEHLLTIRTLVVMRYLCRGEQHFCDDESRRTIQLMPTYLAPNTFDNEFAFYGFRISSLAPVVPVGHCSK